MIEVGDLPPETRIKPIEEEKLWQKVEKKGIAQIAEETGLPRSKIYNWRSKGSFLPLKFVEKILDSFRIERMKGESSSKPVNWSPPIEPDNELMIRIKASVSVNKEGTPIYRTQERELLERFNALLQKNGEVPVEIYVRNGYELRYPSLIQKILKKAEFEEDFAALFDETGRFEDGKMVAGDKEIDIEDFNGKLYSNQKKYRLAIERNDEDMIKEILESVSRVQGFSPPPSD